MRPDYRKLIKPNDWNEYTVIARGPEIILKINGAVASHVIDREKGKAAADGLITLTTSSRPADEGAIQECQNQSGAKEREVKEAVTNSTYSQTGIWTYETHMHQSA